MDRIRDTQQAVFARIDERLEDDIQRVQAFVRAALHLRRKSRHPRVRRAATRLSRPRSAAIRRKIVETGGPSGRLRRAVGWRPENVADLPDVRHTAGLRRGLERAAAGRPHRRAAPVWALSGRAGREEQQRSAAGLSERRSRPSRRSTGTLPVNLLIVAEGEEELGSPNLPRFVERYAGLWPGGRDAAPLRLAGAGRAGADLARNQGPALRRDRGQRRALGSWPARLRHPRQPEGHRRQPGLAAGLRAGHPGVR